MITLNVFQESQLQLFSYNLIDEMKEIITESIQILLLNLLRIKASSNKQS